MYMQNTVSLEEELRKANAARSQLETYKRQVRGVAWFLQIVSSWILRRVSLAYQSPLACLHGVRCFPSEAWFLRRGHRLVPTAGTRVASWCTALSLGCWLRLLWLQQSGAPLYWGAQVFPCGGLPCYRACVGSRSTGFSICGSWA